mmetsp:Transcript_46720/g.113852  ORF Transcript_46720/g.113852 Transcript_46720/m.113852 type:complete len:398 (-) Transcript_46720:1921-3114(-)
MGNSRSTNSDSNSNTKANMPSSSSSSSQQQYPGYIRRAYHAGSWYSDDPTELEQTLNKYMDDAANDLASSASSSSSSMNAKKAEECKEQEGPLRAVICPHAGFRYSGPTAAYSYVCLQQELSKSYHHNRGNGSNSSNSSAVRHILVLHPSHHYYLNGCAVSGASKLETPIGDLQVSHDLRQEIFALNNSQEEMGRKFPFTTMNQSIDEAEHSGEMQYPFIALALKNSGANATVLPIMCGNIDFTQETGYGKLLAPIINRPDVICVVSTDFCHYGRRFQYQPEPSTLPLAGSTTAMEIYQYITELDHEGMEQIELQKPGGFADYLKRTKNTICGRHAIQTWLNGAVATSTSSGTESDGRNNSNLQVKFIKYAQSSQVRSPAIDSSVSYASATARLVLG